MLIYGNKIADLYLDSAVEKIQKSREEFLKEVLRAKGLNEFLMSTDRIVFVPDSTSSAWTEVWLDFETRNAIFLFAEELKMEFKKGVLYPEITQRLFSENIKR